MNKLDNQKFVFPSGHTQLLPNYTTDLTAVVVDKGLDTSNKKVVNGHLLDITEDEVLTRESERTSLVISELRYQILEELDNHLNSTARSYHYDSINSAVSYAEEASVPRFQLEGRAFRKWRSQCYEYAYLNAASITVDSSFESMKEGLPVLDL